MQPMVYKAASRQDTARLASSLAPLLHPGDVLLLVGTLGSGKTAFVQEIAAALGYQDPVTSPTFVLANVYTCNHLTLQHVDTYRLNNIDEFRDLGLDEYSDECVTVVEWGNLIASEYPEYLLVEIDLVEGNDDARNFTLSSDSPRWHQVINSLRRGHLRTVS